MAVSEIRQNLNTAQPYKRTGSGFTGYDPSKPGDFPHKLSGQLQKSIAYSVDEQELTCTIGTAMKHGFFLEMGTRFMAARPWLTRTVQSLHGKIAALFTT